jgi:hypothetical protein
MSPADLATLSLLDPDQGVCPNGHPCRLSGVVGERECSNGEYQGRPLICWEIRLNEIDRAAWSGANPQIVNWAISFLADRAD